MIPVLAQALPFLPISRKAQHCLLVAAGVAASVFGDRLISRDGDEVAHRGPESCRLALGSNPSPARSRSSHRAWIAWARSVALAHRYLVSVAYPGPESRHQHSQEIVIADRAFRQRYDFTPPEGFGVLKSLGFGDGTHHLLHLALPFVEIGARMFYVVEVEACLCDDTAAGRNFILSTPARPSKASHSLKSFCMAAGTRRLASRRSPVPSERVTCFAPTAAWYSTGTRG